MENKTEEAAALAKIQARADAAETAAATAKADMHNINLYNKCLTVYKNAMDNALYRKFDGCYEPNDLQQIHDKARQKSLELVRFFCDRHQNQYATVSNIHIHLYAFISLISNSFVKSLKMVAKRLCWSLVLKVRLIPITLISNIRTNGSGKKSR